MNVKRFVGKNAREAMAQVRAAWGDDAVILANRPIPGGVEILALPGLADVPVDRICDYLAMPGCFVWVALRDATPGEVAQMQQQFGLHELAVEDALHGHQRPKSEEYGDKLFVALQTLELSPTDDLSTGEVNVFVGPNFVLTVRNRSRHHLLGVRERAERAMELAGLQSRRHTIAGAASHGEQRQLEIAMTLATEPVVLLLDEPLAGMGVAEAERMVELLLRLKKDHAMMLVEHDIDALFTLADHLTVMVNGQVIASDTPAAVRADRGVQAAYLGEH